ncbi:TauD/TfdA family dioxygenase [Allorhizobium sp. BGMRC 0089]|uniref:TauD/TfdA family dioxygenase n=1 Tax=Allorhizobium sonneratiae TaxID=2934936 RepID=UPI0020347FF2|nr:TauD/TfdA family dioxygenase [Allorhizobium sonneratiae]MCM2292382.1 TauD/TfdA family dioxygenase [Allorhizobium sonneratiae]
MNKPVFIHENGLTVITATDEVISGMEPAHLNALIDEHGALLFRGAKGGLETFKAFSQRLASSFSDYRGGGLRFGPLDRDAIGGDNTVLSVTGAGQGFGIPLHGEMQYLPSPPELLWFYCDEPPQNGGQTTVAPARAVEERLSDATRKFFADNRILYKRVLGPDDWRKTFLTEDFDEAKAFCAEQGLTMTQRSSGTVDVSYVTDAIRIGPKGERYFINNILFVQAGEDAFHSGYAKQSLGVDVPEWPFVVRSEDDQPLPREILSDIARASEEETKNIDWQSGDFVVLDNRRILHGRRESVAGGKRKILVRMCNRWSGEA